MASIKQSVNETEEQLQCEIIDQADDVSEVEAWQQLPEEPGKVYHAFRLYLHAGAYRSLGSVASALGRDKKYVKQLEKWSSTYNWNARAAARRRGSRHSETVIRSRWSPRAGHRPAGRCVGPTAVAHRTPPRGRAGRRHVSRPGRRCPFPCGGGVPGLPRGGVTGGVPRPGRRGPAGRSRALDRPGGAPTSGSDLLRRRSVEVHHRALDARVDRTWGRPPRSVP